jgi:two-component system alkaline phosphatase synthesis response regulator PhoP
MARILIVDDDQSIVQMLQFILNKEGHALSIARDGKAGLAMARADRPDLIILDVMMPEMDGFTVSGELFGDPDMRDVPIMILTAKGHSRDIFSLVPNVKLYMDKPFDPPDFVTALRTLVPPVKPLP